MRAFVDEGPGHPVLRDKPMDTSLQSIPAGAYEEALVMLSDILPACFECGTLNGKIQPGGTVAIVGAGPVGLAALMTAQFFAPAIIIMVDLDEHRLAVSRRFGATHLVRAMGRAAQQAVLELTGGRGVDTAIEAVGMAATFALCTAIMAPGGTVVNVSAPGGKGEADLARPRNTPARHRHALQET